MISIKDEDKQRLEEIAALLSDKPYSDSVWQARGLVAKILANIHELMQEKPHVRPLIAAGWDMVAEDKREADRVAASRGRLFDAYERVMEMNVCATLGCTLPLCERCGFCQRVHNSEGLGISAATGTAFCEGFTNSLVEPKVTLTAHIEVQ